MSSKPKGFESDLADLEPMYGEHNIHYAWGHRILRHLGDERFNSLSQYGTVEVVSHSTWPVTWGVITKELTQAEYIEQIIKKFGAISKVMVGPKGGFRYVVYGTKKGKYGEVGTTFYGDMANPLRYSEDDTEPWRVDKHDSIVEWEPPSPAMVALAKKRKLAKARKERALARRKAKENASQN